jgi:mRNA interferase MazF
MPTFDAGAVVRVPFPYIDRPVRQYRPALVISRKPVGQGGELLWVLMITSAENRRWATDIPIPAGTDSGLPVDSLVRTAKIATIEASSARRLGQLPEPLLSLVNEQVRATIG